MQEERNRRPARALADWEALRRALSTHKLIRPGGKMYPAAKELFDPRFDVKRPAGIAYCATARDVSACVNFVRKFGLTVSARSGGHSYGGWSSNNGGLIVDVTGISYFNVGAGSVTVGTGIHLIDFYNRLAARGLAVPGGSCATVGIAGLTLGGGVGVLSRAFGLSSDNLESLRIVTADGVIRTASPTSNPNLYWASRGGGGGNFGIAVSFTFRTRRLGSVVLFFLTMAVVGRGPGDGRLAELGAVPAGRAVVQPAHVGRAGRWHAGDPGGRHLPGQRGGLQGAAGQAVAAGSGRPR